MAFRNYAKLRGSFLLKRTVGKTKLDEFSEMFQTGKSCCNFLFRFHVQRHLSLIFVMTYKHKLSSRHEQEFGKLNLERQKLRSCDKTKDLLLNHTLKMMYKDCHSKLIKNSETPF